MEPPLSSASNVTVPAMAYLPRKKENAQNSETSLNNELDYEQMERNNSNAHNKLTTTQAHHREKHRSTAKKRIEKRRKFTSNNAAETRRIRNTLPQANSKMKTQTKTVQRTAKRYETEKKKVPAHTKRSKTETTRTRKPETPNA
jgi:hypothetical protein